jgi:hypothetical protein
MTRPAKRFLHTWWAPAVPLAIVVTLGVAMWVAQRTLVECAGPLACERMTVSALSPLDTTVRADFHNAVQRHDASRELSGADTAARREANEKRRAILAGVARQYNARLVWSFFVLLGCVTALGAAGAAGWLLTRSAEEDKLPYAARLAAVAIPGAVFFAVLERDPTLNMNLMHDVIRGTAGAAGLGVAGAAELMNDVNAFQMGVALMLILACCGLLVPPSIRARGEDPQAMLRAIEHRLQGLRVFLFVATALLVVGILRMQAVGEWVLTFVPPDDAKILSTVLATLTGIMGAFYTLMLAGTYLPAAAILRKRAADAIHGAVPDAEREKEAERLGLTKSPTAWISRVAAILAPLLAGPLGQLLQAVTGG